MTRQPWSRALLVVTSVFLLFSTAPSLGWCQSQKIRQPAVAGAFYPGDVKELGKMVDDFLARATPPEIQEPLMALISPHAGYIYSGQVAAHAYALLKGRKFERVVVISPSHLVAFPFAAVYDGDAYATPLGTIPVDTAFARRLTSMNRLIKLSDRGHTEVQGRGEHALEVQLPFLQRVLGQFKLVPIVMGDQSYDTSRALGVALAKCVQEQKSGPPASPNTLIVASSDLSHFHPYDEAVKMDHKTLTAIEEWDYFNLSRNFEQRVWEACGGGPIVAAMIASERLGANRAKVLKYANSGDVTGDRSSVVGYGAVALVAEKSGRGSKERQFSLTQSEKDRLLEIARKSVETAVRQRQMYQFPAPPLEALMQERGAFVTLKKKGQLRGCIGYVAPMKPLCQTVRDVAALAALRDNRFTPVTPVELGGLEYEISVLSPLRRVSDVKQIRLGSHGLLIKKGDYEGLLLPQVPTEFGWNRNQFLEQTCGKAGLPQNAWQDEDTDIFMFSAIVFGEHEPPQPVIPEGPATRRQRESPGTPPGLPQP